MAYGGGNFLTMNKILPGSYINVVSIARADNTLSDRGIATMALELDWGPDNTVFEVNKSDFQKNSIKLFGYDYTNEKLKGMRDLFIGAKTVYFYRLNSGEKAKSSISEAAYSGIRGNALWHAVEKNADDPSLFDVSTYWDATLMDVQTVSSAADLQDVEHLVTFTKNAKLEANAKITFTDGSNGEVTSMNHQAYLEHIEPYNYNAIGAYVTDEDVKHLYVEFNKRMRDEIGAKAQVVIYGHQADYEGAINIKNKAIVASGDIWTEAALVFWVTGVAAGCAINASNSNRKYDGEFEVDAVYTQAELEKTIKAGEFTFHQVGNELRVLLDINSLITATLSKGDIFKDNKVVRIADQIANDTAALFNTKYLGVIPNGKNGRISLWNDLVKLRKDMEKLDAIEAYDEATLVIAEGDNKNDVVVSDGPLDIVGTMEKLYMTTVLQ